MSIIILNYNGGNTLLECIDSVFQLEDCKFEILLIDNCSTDNSHLICKKKYPDVKLIENEKNLGIGARTIGIEKARGEFIVFLDSDTIVEKNWLSILLDSYKIHGDGLYQSKLLDKKNHSIINTAGNMNTIFGLGYSRGKGDYDKGQFDKFQTVSFTAGACTFSSSDLMRKIGGVDYVFFLYHDDLDYGWRASLIGIPSFYEPKSIVYHLGSPTLKWTKKKFFYLERNRWICLLSLYERKTLIKIFPFLILIEVCMLIFYVIKGMGLAKLKSLFSLIKIRKQIKKRKDDFRNRRKFSDREVIKQFTDEFHLPPDISTNPRTIKFVNSFVQFLSSNARKLI